MVEDFKETAEFNRTLDKYKSNAMQKSNYQHNQIDLLAKNLETNDFKNDRILFEKQIYKYDHGLPNNQVFKELESIRELKKATRALYGSNFDVSPISPVTAIAVEIIEDPTGACKKYNELEILDSNLFVQTTE